MTDREKIARLIDCAIVHSPNFGVAAANIVQIQDADFAAWYDEIGGE